MSIEALGWAKSKDCKNPTTKLVLFLLANYADENFSCYPSEKHLAKLCGVSDRSIRRSLTWLQYNNLIRVEHRKGTSNRYFMRVDTNVHTLRTRVSTYTKVKQKNKRRSKNELAG